MYSLKLMFLAMLCHGKLFCISILSVKVEMVKLRKPFLPMVDISQGKFKVDSTI